MYKMKLIIIFAFLLVSCGDKISSSTNDGKNIPDLNGLKQSINGLINYIVEEDIKKIINMTMSDYKIEVWIDSYASKTKIIKLLQNRKWLYNYLFNSEMYANDEAKLQEQNGEFKSIREQLINAQKNGLKIKTIKRIGLKSKGAPIFVKVVFTWDGWKYKSGIFNNFTFYYNKKTGKWEVSSFLFTIP